MAPGMFALPFIMRSMERKAWFSSRPFLHAPFQVLGVGCFLIFMVPIGCAIFPQNAAVSPQQLKKAEPKAYDMLLAKYGSEDRIPKELYFNKGL